MAAIQPVAVKLEPDMRSRIQQLARALDRSAHYVMREAIAQYLECEKKREALRQDALTAWAEYQATGQHLPHAEADDWLAQLEACQDAEPPACWS